MQQVKNLYGGTDLSRTIVLHRIILCINGSWIREQQCMKGLQLARTSFGAFLFPAIARCMPSRRLPGTLASCRSSCRPCSHTPPATSSVTAPAASRTKLATSTPVCSSPAAAYNRKHQSSQGYSAQLPLPIHFHPLFTSFKIAGSMPCQPREDGKGKLKSGPHTHHFKFDVEGKFWCSGEKQDVRKDLRGCLLGGQGDALQPQLHTARVKPSALFGCL